MARTKKSRKKKGTTIKRGTCRVIRGRVRICARKDGSLYTTPVSKKKSKSTKRKSTKTKSTKRRTAKKPAKCATRPTKQAKGHKGRWMCKSKKTGRYIQVKGWGSRKAS